MDFVQRGINYMKKMCNDDDVCIMIVSVLVGFMLCYLFKNQISGYMNFSEFLTESENSVGNGSGGKFGSDNMNKQVQQMNMKNIDQQIGIELKQRKPQPTPSTQKQLNIMGSKPAIKSDMLNQGVGLKTQDSGIFRPFDEIWNPGFMPLDMVFKNTQPSQMGLDRPMINKGPGMGMDRPMGKMNNQSGGPPKASEEVNLVLIYAPWCGHSKRMLPDFERIKSEFDGKTINGKKINIIMYNSDVDKDKVKEYGVRGFPTLFYESGGKKEPFPHREYKKIKEFLESI